MGRLLFFDFYPLLAQGAASVITDRLGGLETVVASTLADIERVLGEPEAIDLAIAGVGGQTYFRSIAAIDSQGIPIVLFYRDPEKILQLKSTFVHVRGLASRLLDTESFVFFVKQVLEKGKGICPVTQRHFFDHLYLDGAATPKPGEKATSNNINVESLTKREKEIFMMLKGGESLREISRKLKIRPSTVSTLKRKLFTKLEVENIIQLVKKY